MIMRIQAANTIFAIHHQEGVVLTLHLVLQVHIGHSQ